MRMSKIKLILITTLLSSSIIADDKGEPSPILQPGAPGQQTKSISAEEATNIANSSYTTADVYFMQGMICLLYTSPSPRDKRQSRMPSSA